MSEPEPPTDSVLFFLVAKDASVTVGRARSLLVNRLQTISELCGDVARVRIVAKQQVVLAKWILSQIKKSLSVKLIFETVRRGRRKNFLIPATHAGRRTGSSVNPVSDVPDESVLVRSDPSIAWAPRTAGEV